jgi:hypothetical protein
MRSGTAKLVHEGTRYLPLEDDGPPTRRIPFQLAARLAQATADVDAPQKAGDVHERTAAIRRASDQVAESRRTVEMRIVAALIWTVVILLAVVALGLLRR